MSFSKAAVIQAVVTVSTNATPAIYTVIIIYQTTTPTTWPQTSDFLVLRVREQTNLPGALSQNTQTRANLQMLDSQIDPTGNRTRDTSLF